MTKVQIYDKAMCCSTGVCGPQVDPVLPKIRRRSRLAERSRSLRSIVSTLLKTLPSSPSNATVQKMLADEGVECLPLVIVDDRVVSRSEYPSRDNLALWTGTSQKRKRRCRWPIRAGAAAMRVVASSARDVHSEKTISHAIS